MHQATRAIRPNYALIIAILLLAQLGVFLVGRSVKPLAADTPEVSAIPLAFSDWRGRDEGLDEVSLEMLRPDAYLVRDYLNEQGQIVNFTVIYGHGKSNFHSPALCVLGGGWNIISKGRASLRTGDSPGAQEIEMVRLILQKGSRRTILLYSFLSPGRSTASWTAFQARFLGTRLLGREPRGALLRLVVPVEGSEEEADRAAQEFLREIYPYFRSVFAL